MKLEEEARKKKALAASRRQSAVAKEQQARISDLEDQVAFLESQRIEAWEKQVAMEAATSKKKGVNGGYLPSSKSSSSSSRPSSTYQQGRGPPSAAQHKAQPQPSKQQQQPLPAMRRSEVPIEVAESIIDVNAEEEEDEDSLSKGGSFAGSSSSGGCKRKRSAVVAGKGVAVAGAVCEVGNAFAGPLILYGFLVLTLYGMGCFFCVRHQRLAVRRLLRVRALQAHILHHRPQHMIQLSIVVA